MVALSIAPDMVDITSGRDGWIEIVEKGQELVGVLGPISDLQVAHMKCGHLRRGSALRLVLV